jgi:iron complex transport system substrate-binding protein
MAKRIVSLACTHTELLHFLGAGKRIVAVDQFSDFPAKLVSKIGCTIDPWLSDPAKVLEDIDKLEPDLVLLSYPFQKEFFEANKLKNGVEVQLLEAPVGDNWLEDMFAQYRQLGSLAGEEDQAERIIGEMGRDFDAIRLHISRQDENWRAFTREDNSETPTFLLETDSDFYSASRATHLSKVGL